MSKTRVFCFLYISISVSCFKKCKLFKLKFLKQNQVQIRIPFGKKNQSLISIIYHNNRKKNHQQKQNEKKMANLFQVQFITYKKTKK